MAATISTKMERIAQMLVDASPDIVAAYWYTVDAIDEMQRPCWLIFHEDASFENLSVNQDNITTSFSLAFVGAPFTGTEDAISIYEEQARTVYQDTITYLKGSPQLQVRNTRGLLNNKLRALDGVQEMIVTGLSGVTLFSREGVASLSFWGFTISLTIREQLEFDIAG